MRNAEMKAQVCAFFLFFFDEYSMTVFWCTNSDVMCYVAKYYARILEEACTEIEDLVEYSSTMENAVWMCREKMIDEDVEEALEEKKIDDSRDAHDLKSCSREVHVGSLETELDYVNRIFWFQCRGLFEESLRFMKD
ncbi:unnamed protein product [Vicia faba]|uniref:Uncharacterized protein n=1 Tax=Vicia faba TaxID=3906 RepID=A0AAV1B6M2_VICFA|nr:unnamed protein product [Vicia faba]